MDDQSTLSVPVRRTLATHPPVNLLCPKPLTPLGE
jgi:hypothetical protein